ncbi:ABC transporter permease [Desulforamulus aeronauticus]|uniref:Ribose transport system permease protein n=1 Tax=Desulforamulus aeronauticus DSM 10349 TaxID=1121421 RepID=A0A1M6TL95_9FIRM|nr:ABC transporter permease [Desulforamulus aeronauticus]SHK57690.1 ribose transport system permease protein [Desulforamulus aeronauticus DSM 10349]
MDGATKITMQGKASDKLSIGQLIGKYNLLVLLFAFIAIAGFLSPKFLTLQNFLNLLQQSSVTGIMAIGMTFVIIVAGIDLSVGSVAAISGMVVAILITAGWGIPLSIVAALAAGALLGWINGYVSTKFTIPAFIATLAMMVSARGLALLVTNGKPVFGLPEPFSFLGAGFIGRVPVSGLIWIFLTICAALALKYTSFGRNLYAVGGNPEAAHLSGIRVNWHLVSVYVVSGILSALAGIILASWLTVGQPTAAKGAELNAIAAVVLGGASLAGGSGGVWGTFAGVLLMSIITNIFNLVGLASYYQDIFMGLIIVLALVLNKFVTGKKA